MPTLKFVFPGGRYHATPWGHHVNEGMIEWPPSPWRMLRALVACGFSSLGWSATPSHAQQLINKLAAVLPSYLLPKACVAHSRHFMPVGILSKGREQTTLVFDTWADVGDGTMMIQWPCELLGEEMALFSQLAAALGYLGRSESWVEAELFPDNQIQPSDFNAFPHRDNTQFGREYEQISLVAAMAPQEYRTWQQQTTASILKGKQPPESERKPTAKQLEKLRSQHAKAIAPYPPDLVSCLTKDTAWWKQHGWSQPPGSQRVLYWRRSDSIQMGVPQHMKSERRRPITTILLSLTTRSGNRSALPSRARTLPQAELFHRAIISRLGNGKRVRCPELTGKDEHGKPLNEHHQHAHTLPVDLDCDGHLDHIIVYSRMGLGDAAQSAIRTLRRTWTKGTAGEIQLAVAGSGSLDVLRQLPPPFAHRISELIGPPQGASVWESVTPFVPPRYLKRRGKNSLLGQVNAELASRLLPAAEKIDLDSCSDLTRSLRHYVRRRNHGGTPPPVDVGFGLRLTFAELVPGPLLLGYASHYGLGMFRAITG